MESLGGQRLNDDEFQSFVKGEICGDRLLSGGERMCSMACIV